ncbi:small acid-soluble spore protein P [Cohnella faecalis]|uniref:Small acid-soluble spore protein P n=1 Tax=Cohnella faecalis TaxID=2315694 RepID=A0A398CN29_9BACL|nr:small acid-soluble spore protein P [Cohnella faecalis]RIE01317.1 small acid-soluble spore protein P [Cohnella faecalis]
MSKPKTQPVPQPGEHNAHDLDRGHQPNEPLSGSKKVKNRNHVSHHNPQG